MRKWKIPESYLPLKYIDEYRDRKLIRKLTEQIKRSYTRPVSFMEVCGGHTNSIHRFGIPYLLPPGIKLVSGPGCPVCVTGRDFIDKAIFCSAIKDLIITTFGDLIRVPGSFSSLEKERAEGADIRIVMSALDALGTAKASPGKHVVFLAIGFETTAPGTAATILKASKEGIRNFSILCAHKTMPHAMEAIINGGSGVDGFICPGHVAAITGSEIFRFIPARHNLGCVVTGFEPVDLLQSILMLVSQVNRGKPDVENQYGRVVTASGNLLALRILHEVFKPCNSSWRGLGEIKGSGLALREKFRNFDTEFLFSPSVESVDDDGSCICGEILKGRNTPPECSLFSAVCTPANPVGACMVSAEGACNNWFKYSSYE